MVIVGLTRSDSQLQTFSKQNKPRPVLDCRNLNPHLAQFKFKYEDVSVAKQIFQRGDFLFTFDIKSAYHHIEIYPSHKTYVGFSWNNANSVFTNLMSCLLV